MTTITRPPRTAIAALGLAGGIHLSQAPAHAGGAAVVGVTFATFGLAQVAAAIILAIRPGRRARLAAAGLGALGAAAWAASRTVGLPIVGVEPVGMLDATTAALGALAALGASPQGPPPRVRRSVLPGVAVVALTAIAGTAVGVAAPTHRDHAVASVDAESEHHLHGIGTDEVDLGPNPAARAAAPLDADLIAVYGMPGAVALTPTAAYVAARTAGTVVRIVRATGMRSTFAVGGEPIAIAHAFGSLWVGRARGDVLRLDPETGRRLARVPVALPTSVTPGGGLVWVTEGSEGLALGIDPATDTIVASIPTGFGPTAIAHTGGALWVVNTLDREVVRIARGRITATIAVGGGAGGIAATAGSVWVASTSAGTVTRIDATRARITDVIEVDDVSLPGRGPIAVAASDGSVWVLNNHDRTVTRIDAATGLAGRRLLLANTVAPSIVPGAIVADADQVWATDASGDAIAVIGTHAR